MAHHPLARWRSGALLVLGLLGLAGCSHAAAERTTSGPLARQAERATTVIVVRHAERADEPVADPGLSLEGQARARALPDALRGLGTPAAAAIYTTQYRRARDTAVPLAEAAGVAVTERPISAANLATYAHDLAREILARHAGATVLVVGHSNTVPALVAALGGGPPPPLAERDYGDLFQIVIPTSGPACVERSRFGP
jgi:broad specificity phosphatase PhoE